MTDINIKKILEENICDLAEIFDEYQIFYKQTPNQINNLQFLKDVIKNGAIFHVAYINQKAVGFTGVYFSYSSVSAKKIAIINNLFVLSDNRKYGIGKKIMKSTIAYLKNSGISHIRWCTQQNNIKAQKFYQEFSDNRSQWLHYDLESL